jgi:hypothetical protein
VAAVWAQARAQLRATRRSTVALILLVALVGGVVLAAATGARRTDSAFPRLLGAASTSDILVNPDEGIASGLDIDEVAALPGVREIGDVRGMFLVLPDPSYDAEFLAAGTPATFDTIDRPKVLEGRAPDPERVEEVLVTQRYVDDTGIGIGDEVPVTPVDVAALMAAGAEEEDQVDSLPTLPQVRLRVVGIGIGADEIVEDENSAGGRVYLTPAFGRAYEGSAGYFAVLVDLEPGTDVATFRRAVDALVPDETVEYQTTSATTQLMARAVRPQVWALGVFALLAALAGLLVVAQALHRSLAGAVDDSRAFASIGVTPREQLAAAFVRVVAVAGTGAVLAVALAVALSPLTPVGPARTAEPSPGLEVNIGWLVPGAMLIVVVLVGTVVPAFWLGLRRARRGEGVVDSSPSRVVRFLVRSGAGPAMVSGVRMAVEPGRGRSTVPVRSTFLGAAVAVGALLAAVTFDAALVRLLETPPLYGWNWDAMVASDVPPDGLVEAARVDPDVNGLSLVRNSRLDLGDRVVPTLAVSPVVGGSLVRIVDGRAPSAPDEVALGIRTMGALDAEIGSVVEARRLDGGTTPLRVVGQAVLPGLANYRGADSTELGVGAVLPLDSLHGLGPESGDPMLMVDVRDGEPPDLVMQRLIAEGLPDATPADIAVFVTPQRPADIVDLGRVRWTPVLLGMLLAGLALAAVTHALVTTVRRRRRELALLRTLGFSRRQLSATVAWQATTFAVVAVAAGLPLGIAAGRWAWSMLADGLGVPPEPVTPTALAIVVPLAVLVSANLVAAVPAWRAGRTAPAVALRSE